MDLAFVTGYGPSPLTDLEGRGPLVGVEDTVALGFRDIDEQREYGSQPLPADILALDLTTVRRMGVAQATRVAIDRAAHPSVEGFFINLLVAALGASAPTHKTLRR